ncbi:uncharacterized protein LOC108910635 isoform X1 [Anoplophora glabripennis]|uniref:uncharacterized protein LOC108910635 isoform X1 n=1 Tax=Anoplophora glabripennis TaxID=217634 RepID=UPI00087406B3|nr:uncharacterized protein LOC108910635 isoform X1 [Anoplophora glabripennis]
MCFKLTVLALTCLSYLEAQPVEFKPYEQIINPELRDLQPSESRYENPHAAIQAGSKFFQDIYVAMEKPDEVEFGHVAENSDNWEQRFEKINLGNLQRQGKVRWGDKNGGYGEHYYDYNHDGQQEKVEAKPTKKKPHYEVREPEINQPNYITYGQERQESVVAPTYVRANNHRGKREQGLLKDVEFINDNARSLILDGNSQQHGGNYRRADDYRGKREHVINEEDLVFESDKGTFLDRKTGIEYELRPVYQ